MQNSKRNLIIGVAAVAVFVLLIAYGFYSRSGRRSTGGIAGQNSGLNKTGEQVLSESEKARLGPFPKITKEEIKSAEAQKIDIPEVGEKTAPDVAAPVTVQPAAPGISAKLRIFNIKGDKNQFDPSTIIVKVGDTVHINFTAVDKTYDFILPDYGLVQTAGPGETRIVEFGAMTPGKFTYYCKLCGGVESSAVGYIIVAP